MSKPVVDIDALRQLSVSERIQLVEDLWDSIAIESPDEAMPLSPALAAELDRRVADLQSGREKLLTWDEVQARILKDRMHGP